MRDKRVYQRSPIELAASFGIPDDPERMNDAHVVNISGGGFCFESEEKIPFGAKIQLNIDLEEETPLVLDVKVMWIKPKKDNKGYLIGVQILNPKGKTFERFLLFYNEQVKDQFKDI